MCLSKALNSIELHTNCSREGGENSGGNTLRVCGPRNPESRGIQKQPGQVHHERSPCTGPSAAGLTEGSAPTEGSALTERYALTEGFAPLQPGCFQPLADARPEASLVSF